MGVGLPALLALLLFVGPAAAQDNVQGRPQDKPLLIPQVEGARLGRILGRAIACGAPEERTRDAVRAARDRMRAAVGQAFTEDRFLPALNEAIGFETSLPRPSEAVCEKALAAFERLRSGG